MRWKIIDNSDDIFNSFDDGNNYLSMKKFFEQN
jgi:hypothetical protein